MSYVHGETQWHIVELDDKPDDEAMTACGLIVPRTETKATLLVTDALCDNCSKAAVMHDEHLEAIAMSERDPVR